MGYTPALLKQLLSVVVMAALGPTIVLVKSQSTRRTSDARVSSNVFDEVADKVGLKFRHYNGMTGKLFLPEVMGAGAALFDFDNDGDLDVYLVQGSVLAPTDQPSRTLFPWRETVEPRGRLCRNDLVVGKD